MSAILEITQKLQETHEAITRLEASVVKSPKEKTLLLTVKSLYIRQRDLERDFSEISNKEHLDVCSYKLIAENRVRFSISALSSTLHNFQKMVNVVFDSIENGPKTRYAPNVKSVQKSSFDFAYTYPGSLGFVLTVPRERLLSEIFATNMDKTIKAIFEVAKAQNNKEIYGLAEKIGVASIRSVYDWAKSHSQYGVSADIQWKREQKVRDELFIDTTELKHLGEMIESTSEEKYKEFNIDGELVGIDTDLRTFHIKPPDAKDIKGKISDSFDLGHSYDVPVYYTAKLISRKKIHYSYEKEDESWELLSLEKIN